MNKRAIWLTLIGVLLSLTMATWALFRGYFDPGNYEVKQAAWSPDNTKVAVVARRWDHEALNGDDYFVFISDHEIPIKDLKLILHSDQPVFSADAPCLSIRWASPKELILSCNDRSEFIDQPHINRLKRAEGGIAITYEDIPHR
jgi:hypothetical protein